MGCSGVGGMGIGWGKGWVGRVGLRIRCSGVWIRWGGGGGGIGQMG